MDKLVSWEFMAQVGIPHLSVLADNAPENE